MKKIYFLLILIIYIQSSETQQHEAHFHSPKHIDFWINVLYAILLCMFAGFCSGNTVGLLSIERLDLEIQRQSKDEKEKQQAEKILSIIQDHHLLLCTLLLSNAFAMETLPLVIHTIVPAWAAILISTVVVVIIGQIIPQALCTGQNKIKFAEKSVNPIKILRKLLWVICYPLSRCLDYLISGRPTSKLERKDLKALINLQDKNVLDSSQTNLLTSILALRQDKVKKIMIKLDQVFMINLNSKIQGNHIEDIRNKKYSFIPVYKQKKQNIIGILKTKEFTAISTNKDNIGKSYSSFIKQDDNLLIVYEDTNILQMLMLFSSKKERIALVAKGLRKIQTGLQSIYYSKSDMIYNQKNKIEILGIVLLNDIFDELVQFDDQKPQPNLKQIYDHDTQLGQLKKPLISG